MNEVVKNTKQKFTNKTTKKPVEKVAVVGKENGRTVVSFEVKTEEKKKPFVKKKKPFKKHSKPKEAPVETYTIDTPVAFKNDKGVISKHVIVNKLTKKPISTFYRIEGVGQFDKLFEAQKALNGE